jgi:hypothetical protein
MSPRNRHTRRPKQPVLYGLMLAVAVGALVTAAALLLGQ